MYPRFLFHETLAPEGKLIANKEAEPADLTGWFDTPQKFDPAFVEVAPVVPPGTVPVDRPGYVPVQYPSHRFNVDGGSRIVGTAEEDQTLDPAVWKHSPADFTDAAPVAPKALDVPPAALTPLDAQKAELYGAKVADIVARIEKMDNRDALQMVHGLELANPKGARKGVTAAIEKRMAVLVPPPPGE